MVEPRVNEYRPDFVSAPGETLEELLEDMGMSQAELADRAGRPRKTINEIIQGRTAITPETALQFERVLGTPASFWLAREQQYREFLARQQDEAHLAQQVGWLDQIPVRAMIRAQWIAELDQPVAQLSEVLSFFGIAAPAQWEAANALFRRSPAFQGDPGAVSAWLRRGERLAQQLACAAFDEGALRAVLVEARGLTRAPFETAREELPHRCARAGVAVVIVPELPQTRVCGATRWLTPSKALIQLSMRYRTDDQFWFSFFHEAGHVLLHGKRDTFVEEEGIEDVREDEANAFAADVLIPPDQLRRLLLRRRGRYLSRDIVEGFAGEIGIAPGIVVGRLQHDGLLPRTHLNGLKRSIA